MEGFSGLDRDCSEVGGHAGLGPKVPDLHGDDTPGVQEFVLVASIAFEVVCFLLNKQPCTPQRKIMRKFSKTKSGK